MPTDIDALKEEVWGLLGSTQVIQLATCDHGQPRVRTVTLVHDNRKLWIVTGTSSGKVADIRHNPRVEFSLALRKGDSQGYIRGTCAAAIIDDPETRKELAGKTSFFKDYWKSPDDPTFTPVVLELKRVEYMKPGVFEAHTFDM
jgi:general stress protein 26